MVSVVLCSFCNYFAVIVKCPQIAAQPVASKGKGKESLSDRSSLNTTNIFFMLTVVLKVVF